MRVAQLLHCQPDMKQQLTDGPAQCTASPSVSAAVAVAAVAAVLAETGVLRGGAVTVTPQYTRRSAGYTTWHELLLEVLP